MSSRKAIVVGSGAGGSVTAMTLAEAGWHVVVLEKGSNYFAGLGSGKLGIDVPRKSNDIGTAFSNDEIKGYSRYFEYPDPLAYPRTFRESADKKAKNVGSVNDLPVTVGGGTVHYDAKVPRFWDIDFKGRSMLGPQPGADMADWPFEYADIAPYYDDIEDLTGVQGDAKQMQGAPVQTHAPRSKPFPMPPGPQQRTSTLLAKGARKQDLHPYPFPMAANSVERDGRPACNDCGFCGGYGCPILARAGAIGPLHRALKTGKVELRPDSMVIRVDRKGRKATGVTYLDKNGKHRHEKADAVVLAASAIESSRLALLSELPDPHHRIGKRLMFHSFTLGFAIFLSERVHAYRGRSSTQCISDFGNPDFPGARKAAKEAGLPYLRGGVVEMGGSQGPVAEGKFYQYILGLFSGDRPFGPGFKTLMRASILRDRLGALQMIGTDLPYLTNNVTLDEKVKDFNGVPVPRITYKLGKQETTTANFYVPKLAAVAQEVAEVGYAVPASVQSVGSAGLTLPNTKHIMGGMQMGDDPKTSVTDGSGRLHGMDNVYVVDGGVFATSGAGNPTNTIMAVALRTARKLAGTDKGAHAAAQGVDDDARGAGSRRLLPLASR